MLTEADLEKINKIIENSMKKGFDELLEKIKKVVEEGKFELMISV